MQEFVYILPNSEGGVASIVYNLSFYSNQNIYTKIILLDCGHKILLTRNFKCNELIQIKINPKDSIYKKSKEIRKHINENSIIISNDGGFELDMVEFFNLKNPIVYILHGDYQYYYNLVKKNQFCINKIITYSEHMLEKVNDLCESTGSNFASKIYYPVPHISIKEYEHTTNIKIIYASTLCEQKGVHLFKDIIDNLIAREVNFEFTIIGDGGLREYCEVLQKKYSQVKYLGQKKNEEVIEMMHNHDIFFLPTFSEGLPVSIVEAMKVGLVTVTSNIKSGIPEIIFDGKTGFKIQPGDINGYAEVIAMLFNNRKLIRDIGTEAANFANTNFDPGIQTKKYINSFIETTKINRKHYPMRFFKKVTYMFPEKLRLILKNKIRPKLNFLLCAE